MQGIESYAAYVPIYRLSRELLGQIWGGKGKGERAVANVDEDSLTMGVEAGRQCLKGIDNDSVEALYFASTTSPYGEKQSASIIAAALDLREDIITADITDSLRSGTIAFRMALDAVGAGSVKKALVIAADCRIPPPDSEMESHFGDGASAFLIGNDKAVAEFEGSHYLTSEFMGIWRQGRDKYVRTWEDRFVRDAGYMPHMEKAVYSLLKKCSLGTKDITKASFSAPDAKLHKAITSSLKLDAKTQVQDPLFDKVGNTGAAFALMILAGALDEAKPGDKILLANYGDGADAHVLRITDNIEKLEDRNGTKRTLESKLMLENYGKYIKFRNLMEFAASLEYQQRTSLPQLWRDRKWVYRFHGHKCRKCGKIQFPLQKACMYCQADVEFLEEIPLSGKKGSLFTFSMDERAPVPDPPNVLAAVTLEGGGRFFSQVTDRDVNNLKVGMPMELTFRQIHETLGIYSYFWKCRPVRE